mmetsp:Transcript_29967/g.75531  ORF Transcript_29967/g.75531 Transcript_29967/m.75531 type:complete len:170 (-) Transcript_29967:97-606(-)
MAISSLLLRTFLLAALLAVTVSASGATACAWPSCGAEGQEEQEDVAAMLQVKEDQAESAVAPAGGAIFRCHCYSYNDYKDFYVMPYMEDGIHGASVTCSCGDGRSDHSVFTLMKAQGTNVQVNFRFIPVVRFTCHGKVSTQEIGETTLAVSCGGGMELESCQDEHGCQR